jgi:hypothetical protein
MLVKAIVVGILFFTGIAESRASLSWEKKLEFTSPIGVDVVRTAFCFTNTGKTTVSITSIRPSSVSVSTELVKFDYAPGESGKIKATIDLGMVEYAKLQKWTIAVTTSDAPKSPTVLQLRVHVPETVTVSPEALVWHHGEKPKTKDVVVKAGSGVAAIKLIQTASNDNFSVEVKPEVEGQRYRLKITPGRTDVPSYAQIKFDVQSPSFPHHVDCEVNLNVE